jgi:uncharacterized phiE125 gp8 family phage protein
LRYIGDAPRVEAVTPAEFKAAVHIREGDVQDDAHFAVMIAAAQQIFEDATGRPIGPGEFELTVPWARWRRFWFPCRPVASIDEVILVDPDGQELIQPMDGLRLARGADEPQMVIADGWAGLSVTAGEMILRFTAGEDPADQSVQPMRQGIILLVKEWFDAGLSLGETVEAPRITMGARRLVKQARYRRPCVIGERA